MNEYLSVKDIPNIPEIVAEAIELKKNPLAFEKIGCQKTLGMLFFNNSLRTRLSTQKAALNLGMHAIVMNFGSEGWSLEFEDGVVMNGDTTEHVKEAAQAVSQYCDIIAIRAFASLADKEKDIADTVLQNFKKYATVPIVNMESAIGHPLQALTDAITIEEHKKSEKPKVVFTWAPHPKALPHAVANSFVQIMSKSEVDFVLTHPEGYELNPEYTEGITIEYDQDKAFANADFIVAKNWSSYNQYGQVLNTDPTWMVTPEKMNFTNNAKFMHCLPVRRNVVVADAVLDSPNSLVIEQANNRTYAAQAVLKKLLEI